MKRIFLGAIFYSTVVFSAETNDNYYNEALKYLSGEKGAITITKTMPNCPYEKCAQITNNDGTHTFSFTKKDYKMAVSLLYKSVIYNNNPNAAQKVLDILLKQLNWREPRPDKYLLAKLSEDYGLDYNHYCGYVTAAVISLKDNKQCNGFFISAQLFEGGYLGIQRDVASAGNDYAKAAFFCPPDNYNHVIAMQKAKFLTSK